MKALPTKIVLVGVHRPFATAELAHHGHTWGSAPSMGGTVTQTHTLTHSVLTAIFPGEPELADCPLNSP